jgi:murein L,D-transpeptidase YafK
MRWGCCVVACLGVVLGARLLAASESGAGKSRVDALALHVWKTRHEMRLLEYGQVVRTFHIALGRDPKASKLIRGDGRTPRGRYYVCEKRPQSRFHRFLGISYPNIDDAEKAYAERLISTDEWAAIFFANLEQTVPPWSTPLGGHVGIHGYGGRVEVPIDWTEGCIAVRDADIDYLYDRVPLGTPVIIDN